MKVYLATAGEYSDYRVCRAFARREDAEAYPLGDDVLEMDVHDSSAEVRPWHRMRWFADRPDRKSDGFASANPSAYEESRDFDNDPRHVKHWWNTSTQPADPDS